MPLLIIAVVVLGFVLLSRTSSAAQTLNPNPVPALPATGIAGSVATGIIGATAGATTSLASDATSDAGLSTSSAIPIVGSAIAAVAGALLAAHQQRLKDATNENAAVAAAVPSFYQTLQQIINLYNEGQLSKADTINALTQLDAITYAKLRSFVGSPGTAWNSSQSGVCDKTCTVGCCIYNTWLHVDIVGSPAGSYGQPGTSVRGAVPMLQSGQGGTKNFAGIPTNKYNFPGYASFKMTIAAG